MTVIQWRLWQFSVTVLLTNPKQGLWTLCMTLQVLRHSDVTNAQSVVLYKKSPFCPGQVLSRSLTYGHYTARSKVQCAALCLPDFSCHSFTFDARRRRCHLGSETSLGNCSNMISATNLQHYDMTTTCHNGGVLQVSGSCVCPLGYSGDDCAMLMTDCDDYYHKANFRENGVHWIYPTLSPYPFPVYCRMLRRPRTYVMNRNTNDVNFTRGWQDYRDGFGNLTADFWLGLEKMHFLTSSGDYELSFRVRLRSDTNLFQHYRLVQVDDEQHNYRLSVHTQDFKGTLGDSITPSNGANFSTPDRDNDDNDDVHCARVHQAGFWFKGDNCTLCNPTGPLLQPEDELRRGVPGEVFWDSDLGQTVPYKFSIYLVNVQKRRKRND